MLAATTTLVAGAARHHLRRHARAFDGARSPPRAARPWPWRPARPRLPLSESSLARRACGEQSLDGGDPRDRRRAERRRRHRPAITLVSPDPRRVAYRRARPGVFRASSTRPTNSPRRQRIAVVVHRRRARVARSPTKMHPRGWPAMTSTMPEAPRSPHRALLDGTRGIQRRRRGFPRAATDSPHCRSRPTEMPCLPAWSRSSTVPTNARLPMNGTPNRTPPSKIQRLRSARQAFRAERPSATPMTTPSTPSNAPACGTVSRCDRMKRRAPAARSSQVPRSCRRVHAPTPSQ